MKLISKEVIVAGGRTLFFFGQLQKPFLEVNPTEHSLKYILLKLLNS